jgi:hypothetical protein
MATDHHLSEVDLQMAAFQLSRQTRFQAGSTPKRWSGRVEKPRSQQNSPATDYRRRAYSTARQIPSGQYTTSNSQIYAPRAVTRPFSWAGPTTSTTMRVPAMDYLASPTASSYIATPAYSSYTSTPYQYPNMQPMYHDVSEFATSSNRTASVTSASSYYSNDSYSASSPVWSFQKIETTMPARNDEPSNNGPPAHAAFWSYSPLEQIAPAQHQQALMSPPMTSSANHHSNDDHFNFTYSSEYLLDRPPSPDLLWSGKKTDDDGEVLVALGLYDLPSQFDSPTNEPRKLKLAETWQPPPTPVAEESDESAEEDEEIDFPKPAPGTSWFI